MAERASRRGSTKEKEPEWDQDFEPLMKAILGKKGLKTKGAKELGQRQRDYFRGRDFKKLLTTSPELLKKKCSAAMKIALDGKTPETDEDVEKVGAELIQRGFCYKAVYKPLNPNSEKEKAKKWPDRLVRTPHQHFEIDGYYIIAYEGSSGMRHFLLGLIIAAVLLMCMFPVWPIWAKIGMWYLSVVFLTVYFGVLILRMLVFTIFWIVGFDFWILPNLNDEYLGFLDCFRPLYSFEKRKDDLMMLIVRFGSLAIVAVAIDQIAQTTSFDDLQNIVTAGYADVIDWGVDKLTALPGSDKAHIPSIEALKENFAKEDNETEEEDVKTVADVAETDDDADVVNVDESESKENA